MKFKIVLQIKSYSFVSSKLNPKLLKLYQFKPLIKPKTSRVSIDIILQV